MVYLAEWSTWLFGSRPGIVKDQTSWRFRLPAERCSSQQTEACLTCIYLRNSFAVHLHESDAAEIGSQVSVKRPYHNFGKWKISSEEQILGQLNNMCTLSSIGIEQWPCLEA